MPSIKISNLPAAASAVGTDVFPADQSGPVTRKIALSQVATLFNSNFVQLAPSGAQTITTYGLTVPNLTTANLSFDVAANSILSTNTNGNIALQSNGSGQYVVGQSGGVAPVSAFGNALSVVGNPGTTQGFFGNYSFTNNTSSPAIFMVKSRATTVGGHTIVQTGDVISLIQSFADNGTSYVANNCAEIRVTADTVTGSVIPGIMTLRTRTSGGTLTTALTISSAQAATFASTVAGQGIISGLSTGAASNYYQSFSPNSSLGSIIFRSTNNSGNYANNLSNIATTAARTWNLPDADGTIALTSGASGIVNSGTAGQLAYYAGTGTTVSGTNAGTGVLTALGQNVNGSGAIALTTSPTFVTPVLGAASATSVSFSSTSGIIGTTTNNNAAAGSVGEVISSTVLIGSAVSVTNATKTAVTTISLTAGDWDVWGSVWSAPAAGTITTVMLGAVTSSVLLPNDPSTDSAVSSLNFTTSAGLSNTLATGPCRISVASTTTIYLYTYMEFSVSTMGAYGQLTARRRR